ncbi:MAG: site-specific integrase [Actinomycetota bacterium]|nr:site-specific integrase [Actinomycetota bacterium]
MAKRKVTVESFLWQTWLPAIKSTIRTSTYLSYRSHLRNHICPYIGGKRLDRIDGSTLNELYATLLERGRTNGRELSGSTVRRVHAVLHRAFRDATRWELISRNPATSADPPKLRASRRIEFSTWTPQELRSFLDSVRHDKLYPLWLLLATTGMRRGEVLGLRWCDVDFARGELAIRQTVVSHDYVIAMSEPKTARGRRVVALDEHTAAALRTYKDERCPQREDQLVFCYRTGTPLNPIDISKRFVRLSKTAGLRRIRLHDLRHTHATLALQAGIHPKIVSERLGHSTIAFTLDVYSHAIPHLQKEAAAEVAALVLGRPEDDT